MRPVGIIVNPAFGKGIATHGTRGTTCARDERVDTIARILRALDALDVSSVRILPDPTGLAEAAIAATRGDLGLIDAAPLALPGLTRTKLDSERAAAAMRDLDFGCIVVLGGDGTLRAVAAACGDVPLIPIALGASSAFPGEGEGTLVGLAAAACAAGALHDDTAVRRVPWLQLLVDGKVAARALVDIAVLDAAAGGGVRVARERGALAELFLAQARPGAIGLSAIGAALPRVPAGHGLHVEFAPARGTATVEAFAPLEPGIVGTLDVASCETLAPGTPVAIRSEAGVLALDGECELCLEPGRRWAVALESNGPRIVDVTSALAEASAAGFFLRDRRPAAARRGSAAAQVSTGQ